MNGWSLTLQNVLTIHIHANFSSAVKIKTSHNTGKANNAPQKTTLSTFDDEACTNMEQTCEIHSVLKNDTHTDRWTDRKTEQ